MEYLKRIWWKLKRRYGKESNVAMMKNYRKRYEKYAFAEGKCESYEQYEACITRLYHTIEKGLAYLDYRAGFGRKNVDTLIREMKFYAQKYDVKAYFYECALATLESYVKKNQQYGLEDRALAEEIAALPGKANHDGGVREFQPLDEKELKNLGFAEFLSNRHSMRHFSDHPVEMERVEKAIQLAQHTPSACNRQGWSVKVICGKQFIAEVLKNQNGNRGFGQEFDKLLLVVGDLRAFNQERELFQVYIDGGMYAANVLNALHYYHIASVPLSAALTAGQEEKIRQILGLAEAEVPIIFIGIGNYPEKCQTTKSDRREARIEIKDERVR